MTDPKIPHTIIIAEAGVNHNGNMDFARQLIDAAAAAGADYVKFQSFSAERLVSEAAGLAEYQVQNTGGAEESQYSMLKKLELSDDDHRMLKSYAESKRIRFLSTAFDHYYINFLFDLGIDFFKVPSGEITNKPYLQHIASKGLPVVLSTGMATVEEIENAMSVLIRNGIAKHDITVLQCTTSYPADIADSNLKVIPELARQLGVKTGYSDHTLGIEAAIAATALGAVLIEKHFTLDKTLPGPDHLASLTPSELAEMVSAIRNIEKALGNGIKQPSDSELKNKTAARKSLHVNKDLPQGHVLATDDLIALRPGDGISPMEIDKVVGRELNRAIIAYEMLTKKDMEW